jgi:Arm DNA-binding domain
VQWTDPVTKRKVREPLGIWGSLSIDQAREAAKVRLGQVAKGINPRAERLRLKAEKDRERAEAALSFEALVDGANCTLRIAASAIARRRSA